MTYDQDFFVQKFSGLDKRRFKEFGEPTEGRDRGQDLFRMMGKYGTEHTEESRAFCDIAKERLKACGLEMTGEVERYVYQLQFGIVPFDRLGREAKTRIENFLIMDQRQLTDTLAGVVREPGRVVELFELAQAAS